MVLRFADHCRPLTVSSVSPMALLNHCLSTGFSPLWIPARCSLSMKWGRHTGASLSGDVGPLVGGAQTTCNSYSLPACLPSGGAHR